MSNSTSTVSSATCLSMANKYESIQSSISNLVNNITECKEYIDSSKEVLNQLQFNDEAVDEGKMEEFSQEQSNVVDELNILIKECTAKKAYWNSQYQTAKEKENNSNNSAKV